MKLEPSILRQRSLPVPRRPALAGDRRGPSAAFYSDIEFEADPMYRDKFVDPAKAKLEENDKHAGVARVGCIDVDAGDRRPGL